MLQYVRQGLLANPQQIETHFSAQPASTLRKTQLQLDRSARKEFPRQKPEGDSGIFLSKRFPRQLQHRTAGFGETLAGGFPDAAQPCASLLWVCKQFLVKCFELQYGRVQALHQRVMDLGCQSGALTRYRFLDDTYLPPFLFRNVSQGAEGSVYLRSRFSDWT
jgi:hypothetical protein